ncbi:B12-binding domain-containing radical SAM protein [Catellatospora sichuanensis]|uniref:B12-binding domain-containing radical SAM protein n=1 Tax=Catellatospora sichuanensis TaxID=1969805 RepID=UPI0011824F14|nr:radical SAM protein [Catellatospora sichuanensis]
MTARVLLVSGLGPTHKNDRYVRGTLFSPADAPGVERAYFAERGGFSLSELGFTHGGARYPLMRPRRWTVPHLTTFTLQSILARAGVDHAVLDTAAVWNGTAQVPPGDFGAVLLSTTFIWDRVSLAKALGWLTEYLPGCPVVLGGQYSNLKWAQIMQEHPEVDVIVRGDAENVLAPLLSGLRQGRVPEDLPNLVHRDASGRLRQTPVTYADFDALPAPAFEGDYPSVPYESMRGCPFACKFCSFPAASPEWRYRSAERIRDDWLRYAERNGATFVKAMDSTFTVPPARLRRLFELLPSAGVAWEAYSRANTIRDERTVARLAASHCRTLSIGFESMSESSLRNMNKKVTAAANRKAFQLLNGSPIGYRCSFMVGYPGETPEDYRLTHDFLTTEFSGHFTLSVFGVSDETMPLWQDRERFAIEVSDPANPDFSWRHVGMDVDTAYTLNHRTLDEVRRRNDDAVLIIWQDAYQRWLMPALSRADNLRVEKTVERIAMLPRDHPDPAEGLPVLDRLLDRLARWGCHRGDPATYTADPLITD